MHVQVTTVLCTKLQSTEEKVKQLGTELGKANKRLVELWQENCKQLLNHGSERQRSTDVKGTVAVERDGVSQAKVS